MAGMKKKVRKVARKVQARHGGTLSSGEAKQRARRIIADRKNPPTRTATRTKTKSTARKGGKRKTTGTTTRRRRGGGDSAGGTGRIVRR